MEINSIHYRDFLSITFGDDIGFGIVSTIDELNNTVTFSKFDILKRKQKEKAFFKGLLEGITLNFSSERFQSRSISKFLDICFNYGIEPNFKLEDFFQQGDFINTGVSWLKDRREYSIIGLFDRIETERGFNGREYKVIFVNNPMLCRGYELLPADNGAIRRVNPFTLTSSTKLLNDDKLREIFMTYETCKDYTIQGLLV